MSDPTSTRGRRRDFAPFSGEPSTRLAFVAGYFSLAGAFGIAGVCIGLVFSIVRGTGLNAFSLVALAGIGSMVAAGFLWTGRALRERSTPCQRPARTQVTRDKSFRRLASLFSQKSADV